MGAMNAYQKEQLDALVQVRHCLATMNAAARGNLIEDIQPYLTFRHELQQFINSHMGSLCTQTCFMSQMSACCSKDGIITFWADVVINASTSDGGNLEALASAIRYPLFDNKCIYLGSSGCLWSTTPLVCAMFVCEQIESGILAGDAKLRAQWERYRQQAKSFRWPIEPVLFDHLETLFMDMGCRSPIMYLHNSPGLLRIKRNAGMG